MRDTINVPIAIPAWSLATMVAGALFTAGTLYNQMSVLIESNKNSSERITLISEKQINAGAAIATLQLQVQSHDARLTNVEHAIFERGRK